MDIFGDKILKLKTHDFFARKQFIFIDELKKNLQEGEFVICCDFDENYAFVIQNSTQSFHWNTDQATIFTVVVYYKERDELKHISIAIISDNLIHDTVSVYTFQKIIISHVKSLYNVDKIYYVSDGAGKYFKNKITFQNLLFHEKILALKLSGISIPLHMAKVVVMALKETQEKLAFNLVLIIIFYWRKIFMIGQKLIAKRR